MKTSADHLTQTRKNVPCPACGCVCDDVSLQFDDAGLSRFHPTCQLGESWFRSHWHGHCSNDRTSGQPASGQPSGLEGAIAEAANILRQAEYPLVYGLSRSATAGQRAAVSLAETLGGVVDSTASLCHGPSIMALQEVGEVTSTLGEVRNRADLVIFWGSNPAKSHPRHAERYSVFSPGKLTPGGRANRTIVMVGDAGCVHDWRLDPAGSHPDLVLPVNAGSDFEVLSQLRAILHGSSAASASRDLHHLMELMKGCRYGVVFFGLGLAKSNMGSGQSNSRAGHVDVAALLCLVAELNEVTRFTARRMRLQGDVSGADNVLCWQTGYPFGVDFSRGYPRYNPGEYTANELLERGDVDACLLVGAESVEYFSQPALQHLRAIPTVLVDYVNATCPIIPSVQIRTAVYGIHTPGTIYRMDNVPMRLQKLCDSDLPTDEHVLNKIRSHCL